MSNEIKRMKYFNGQLLKEEDLALEQEYHMKLQRLHNRFFHDWGIVDGLTVEAAGNYPQVTVSQGLALNRITKPETKEKFSQEIWICENHPDNPVNLSEYDAEEDIYITVSYAEEDADVDNKKGGDKKIHVWERSKINHSREMPEDPSKEIVLARVRLKSAGDGNKTIAEISTTEADGITQICTYAVTQGTAQEFQKISIGEKDKLNLPYIQGYVDKSLGNNDGLEVNSLYTKFDGTVLTGNLKTNGTSDLNGTFAVNVNNGTALKVDPRGDVYIAKTASVAGGLTSTGGLNVSGDNTVLNTTHVEMTGNMFTVNKYTPADNETDPRSTSSGVEVFRGGTAPDAKFIWDEAQGVWKAGTDKKEGVQGSGLYNVAYGADWDKMHGGVNVDTLHKHSQISDANNNSVLTVDSEGGVNIEKSITVSGSIAAKGGIEVPRGDEEPKARLEWNENDRKWQIGLEQEMYNIPYGENWTDLTTSKNADHLHTHSELYNSDGHLVISSGPTGDVSINSNLSIGKDLVVEGKLTVLDTATQFVQMQQVVTENVVLVNKPEDGQEPVAEGGLEVYRGSTLPNARIIWDEGSDSWKIGTGSSMSEIPSGIEWEYLTHGQPVDSLHKHSSLTDVEGNAIVTVDADGNVEADGNLTVNENLSVEKDALIKGDISLKGSMTIEGDLTVNGTHEILNTKTIEIDDNVIVVNRYTGQSVPVNNEAGLEVYRGGGFAANAKLLWNEAERKWKIGTGDDMRDLPYGEEWDALTSQDSADQLHTHGRICDTEGTPVIDLNQDGSIDIAKNTKVNGGLVVEGPVTVTGELHAINLDSINKVDLHVEDNVILLNKYEGAAPPITESGIEIYRGDVEPKARLVWDETAGKWKLGLGNQLKEIAYGNAWDQLTGQDNADDLHIHGQLYNERGDVLALSTRATGNVDVVHDLTVGQDLAILGNIDVRGPLTRINSSNVEIVGNSIVMNRVDSGEVPKVDSGLSIYRGVTEKNAVMVWDGKNNYWKMGLFIPESQQNAQTLKQFFKVFADGGIEAPSAIIDGQVIAKNAIVQDTLTIKNGIEISPCDQGRPYFKWDDISGQWKLGNGDVINISAVRGGNVGIGTSTPQGKLDVNGNAVVRGNVDTSGNSVVQGTFTSGSAEIKGSLTVDGNVSMSGGLEVVRGVDSTGQQLEAARIVWNESKNAWTFGVGDNLGEIILNGQNKPYRLYTENGNVISVSTDDQGRVGIGTVNPNARLDVVGDAIIEGKMSVRDMLDVSGNGLFNGKVSARNSFELVRDAGQKAAKLYWDETRDIWQAGTETNLKDISLSGHTHSSLHTQGGSQIVNVDSSGNVGVGKDIAEAKLDVNGSIMAASLNIIGTVTAGGKLKGTDAEISSTVTAENATISRDLTVNRNLTVSGDLTVNGEVVTVNTTTLNIEDNIITLNKYTPQPEPANRNAGIEVYRGGTASNAQIIWDEDRDEWKAGTVGGMKLFSYSDHTHPEFADLTNIAEVIKAADGKIGIGTETPSEKLSVAGNADIDGSLSARSVVIDGSISAASASVNGSISAASAVVSGSLTAGSTNVSGDLSVSGSLTNNGKAFSYSDHTHNELTAINNAITLLTGGVEINGSITADSAAISGEVTAGSAAISGGMTAGSAAISGDLAVTGNLTVNNGKTVSYSDHRHSMLYAGGENEAEVVTVDADGNVGIGIAPEADIKLNVGGIVQANNITQTSSKIYKENIEELTVKTAVELLKKLNPVTFDYKSNYLKKHNIGFIAEDVPEIFTTTDCKSISIMDIVAVLTAVVKKQQIESAAIKKQVKDLQKQIADLIGQ